jgi:hypothetical protein
MKFQKSLELKSSNGLIGSSEESIGENLKKLDLFWEKATSVLQFVKACILLVQIFNRGQSDLFFQNCVTFTAKKHTLLPTEFLNCKLSLPHLAENFTPNVKNLKLRTEKKWMKFLLRCFPGNWVENVTFYKRVILKLAFACRECEDMVAWDDSFLQTKIVFEQNANDANIVNITTESQGTLESSAGLFGYLSETAIQQVHTHTHTHTHTQQAHTGGSTPRGATHTHTHTAAARERVRVTQY